MGESLNNRGLLFKINDLLVNVSIKKKECENLLHNNAKGSHTFLLKIQCI